MAKKRPRISFDPEDPDMKRVIDEIAKNYDLPPGDVMNLITLVGIDAITSGQVDLEDLMTSSDLLRYKHRLNLADRLARFKRRHGKK
jgi:hypothetical protein